MLDLRDPLDRYTGHHADDEDRAHAGGEAMKKWETQLLAIGLLVVAVGYAALAWAELGQ